MQSVSSRIWTRVAVSISYNDNHYTTGTSRGTRSCISKHVELCQHVFILAARLDNPVSIAYNATQKRILFLHWVTFKFE